jgi:FtsP/CotA-like multicopper oxidase with cupredoxin domain
VDPNQAANSGEEEAMTTRRRFLARVPAAAAGVVAAAATNEVAAQAASVGGAADPQLRRRHPQAAPGIAGRDYRPVVTPNGATLPWRVVDGAKVYHLVAQEVRHEFVPGLVAICWGYNGRVHGPTLEAVEGDRVRIYVTNKLPAATSVHWHGILLPNGMDGVAGLTQRAIPPGDTFKYEFVMPKPGTFMYHSHHDEMIQIAMGLAGMVVVHPRARRADVPQREFVLLLHEWRIDVGTGRPNPNEMVDFNMFTMNARAFPGTAPLVARRGERVRLRIGNLSANDHHPIHLHGHHFRIVATDGGAIPTSAQWPESTVLVPVGSTRDVEFVADAPGDWMLHCHMTHHVMNQMGHDIPNMIGVDTEGLDQAAQSLLPTYMSMGQAGMAEGHGGAMAVPRNSVPMLGAQGPFDPITMGGMATILKVRESMDADPSGWYTHPAGTVAAPASADEMRRDGLEST